MAYKDIVKEKFDNKINRILQLSTGHHLIIGFSIRLLLVIYGSYHDQVNLVKYTDVDYRVYTDAARHVVNGDSPYERHAYRYSPIIAWLMVPNILVHENFGKVLFCVFDILIANCIKSFILRHLHGKANAARVAKYCSLFWLYNPLSIAISTRGNADSVSCYLILMSLYYIQLHKGKRNIEYAISGLFLGVAIHLRLYPIFFSLPMYLSLGEYMINKNTPIMKGMMSLIPNRQQIILTISTIFHLIALTYGLYLVYGYKYLFESYIFHLFRRDARHNFSLFFYHEYLRMTDMTFDWLRLCSTVLHSLLTSLISLTFGTSPQTLPFAVFCQAAVMVLCNTVVTSQYFMWYLSLLPLVVQDIKTDVGGALMLVVMWSGGQLFWLFNAYLLEFLNQEVFIIIWVACVFFFGSCVAVLIQLVFYYTPGYSFGIATASAKVKTK